MCPQAGNASAAMKTKTPPRGNTGTAGQNAILKLFRDCGLELVGVERAVAIGISHLEFIFGPGKACC